jgi:hypothetical protein
MDGKDIVGRVCGRIPAMRMTRKRKNRKRLV